MGTEDSTSTDEQKEQKGTGDVFTPITSQEDLDKIIGQRLARERAKHPDYATLKDKAEKYDAAIEEKKSETQKAEDRAKAAEKERDQIRLEHLRLSVALDKGLTPTQAKRLVGNTREEIEADAEDFLNDIGKPPSTKQPTKPVGALKSGASSKEADGMTGKQRAAEALRRLGQNRDQ